MHRSKLARQGGLVSHATERAVRQDSPAGCGEDPREWKYIYHPSFSLPGAEKRLWSDGRDEIPVPRYNLLPEVETSEAAYSVSHASLSKNQEKMLFQRYNYAKYRACKLARRKRQTLQAREQMRLWRDRAVSVREKIIHANLPLVPAMAKRFRVSGSDFVEWIAEGYMAILRCVEKFDVSRGFKFSTYACRAIFACFQRTGSKAQTYRKYFPVLFKPEMEQSDYVGRRHDRQREDAVDAVRRVLKQNRAELSDMERRIINKRFPMLSEQQPMTLAQVGRDVKLSNERVRQIELRSLLKLRVAVEEQYAV